MTESQELRRRNVSAESGPRLAGSGLSAPRMLTASPQEHGYVLKLHVSPFFMLLPRFLQKLISKIWLLKWFAPKWERRYLILLGSYLYKFTDTYSTTPKGSPIQIDAVNVNLIGSTSDISFDDQGVAEALQSLPRGCDAVFVVSTLRKRHYYATSDRDQALTWVNSLRQARQEAITRSMGHAPSDSYPTSWIYYDSLGKSLLRSKNRIRAKLEERNLRELEMSSIGGGGSFPRGYYG